MQRPGRNHKQQPQKMVLIQPLLQTKGSPDLRHLRHHPPQSRIRLALNKHQTQQSPPTYQTKNVRSVESPYESFQRRLRRLNVEIVTFLSQLIQSHVLQELMRTAFHFSASLHESLGHIPEPLPKRLATIERYLSLIESLYGQTEIWRPLPGFEPGLQAPQACTLPDSADDP